jgi:hypothetical protein
MAVTHIRDLVPDPANRRSHNPRNVGMIVDALHQVGAARSIVIDEDNVVQAGNGVVEAAAEAGITKVRVVDVDGSTLVAVRRSGLTPEQKRALAMFDNRTAELAEWNAAQLQADALAGVDLSPWFSASELTALGIDGAGSVSAAEAAQTLAERFGVPPFSVLDARQGYWQTRKRAWLALGIESEIGRGEDLLAHHQAPARQGRYRANATPGGALMPAANYSKNHARGNGRGRPIA